ncbi:MAG: hypothetical protein KF691_07125 [Phycisphaeraceae bacterium]|nr:hypothetical protein [Phycisphaeraceae bacterium]
MSEANRILARQTSRANTIASAVASSLHRNAVRRVCAVVTDAGGHFNGLTARTARLKVRSVFKEDPIRHVIQYHATLAAREWRGPADEALRLATIRAVRAIGPLLGDMAYLSAVRLLVELAGTHPEALSPEVAEHVRKRVG